MARNATWALVTDGVRARFVRDLDGHTTPPRPELISKAGSARLLAVLSDPASPVAVFDRDGRCAGASTATDAIIGDMRDFARSTLKRLQGAFEDGAFQRLAIFAPPRVLEILREEMPMDLGKAVVFDSALDLVWLPEADLRRRVSAELGETGGKARR